MVVAVMEAASAGDTRFTAGVVMGTMVDTMDTTEDTMGTGTITVGTTADCGIHGCSVLVGSIHGTATDIPTMALTIIPTTDIRMGVTTAGITATRGMAMVMIAVLE